MTAEHNGQPQQEHPWTRWAGDVNQRFELQERRAAEFDAAVAQRFNELQATIEGLSQSLGVQPRPVAEAPVDRPRGPVAGRYAQQGAQAPAAQTPEYPPAGPRHDVTVEAPDGYGGVDRAGVGTVGAAARTASGRPIGPPAIVVMVETDYQTRHRRLFACLGQDAAQVLQRPNVRHATLDDWHHLLPAAAAAMHAGGHAPVTPVDVGHGGHIYSPRVEPAAPATPTHTADGRRIVVGYQDPVTDQVAQQSTGSVVMDTAPGY